MGSQYSYFDPYIFQYMYESDKKNWEIINQGRMPGVPLNYGSYPPSSYGYGGYGHGGYGYGGYGYPYHPYHLPQPGGHRPARLPGTLPYSYPPVSYAKPYSNY
ncbi:hypothetical protein DM01DRAFT_1404039 [Hesseltinella vesiculosa]|uniref:Uncharacterized protein n=1 Tax=Hesseltinella vesiculosa TaxID=101127 RepID=A0A1X2GWM8_9FUNG|nr:hypothetical protein DM01DRAFT_1404039 [Hesseltinella vesiculosa]